MRASWVIIQECRTFYRSLNQSNRSSEGRRVSRYLKALLLWGQWGSNILVWCECSTLDRVTYKECHDSWPSFPAHPVLVFRSSKTRPSVIPWDLWKVMANPSSNPCRKYGIFSIAFACLTIFETPTGTHLPLFLVVTLTNEGGGISTISPGLPFAIFIISSSVKTLGSIEIESRVTDVPFAIPFSGEIFSLRYASACRIKEQWSSLVFHHYRTAYRYQKRLAFEKAAGISFSAIVR